MLIYEGNHAKAMSFKVIATRSEIRSAAIERMLSGLRIPTEDLSRSGLRIGTYNTALVSLIFKLKHWGHFIKDPIGITTAHTWDSMLRAGQIANRILSSGYDYDVIALSEVFSEPARKVIVSKLSTEYPYFLEKLPTSDPPVSSRVIGGIAGYFGEAVGYLLDMLGVDLRGLIEDSGLMLFSRFPIIDSCFKVFTFPSDEKRIEAQPDSLANKGAGYARILHPHTSLHYNIIFTHLQTNDAEFKWVRDMEIGQYKILFMRL
jgi:hypothetical protein